MVSSAFLLAAAVTAAAPTAASQPPPLQQPTYAPEAAWVHALPLPRDVKPSGAAVDILLLDSQSRLEPGGGQLFVESATRINTAQGLQQVGNLAQAWDPATQTLTIHRARILRGDKVIDLLADGHRLTVLRRETNLEAAILDGQLTATLQPEGLQVGDILDLAITIGRHEPALGTHGEGGALLIHAGVVSRLHASVAWPKGESVKVWKTDDLPALTPRPAAEGDWQEVVLDQTDAINPEPPKDAPISAQVYGLIAVSDFADWRQVSQTAYPLFAKAATLKPDSPLKAEIARIRASSPDPKARTLAALELVESQTRYLAVMLNAGGLTPAPADLTWVRRFGDCKGKVALLLALLDGLGVKAEPALVSVSAGESLDHISPKLDSFDHVIVRAEIGGHTYWLDPTRVGDENLDVIPTPNYRWALPVRSQGADLVPLAPPVPTLPLVETVETVDLSGGVAKPAHVHSQMILRGDGGWAFGMLFQRAGPVERDRALKAAFANSDPWVTPDKVGFTYDPQKMEARLTLDGTGVPPFTTENQSASADRDWMISSSSIGFDPDFTRRTDYHRDAPYVVAFPAYVRNSVDVRLPNGGKGFEALNGDSIERTVAGVEYSRAAAVVGDRFTMVASGRAVAQSFPAAEAPADADALRSLADYDVSLRSSAPEPAPVRPAAVAAPGAASGSADNAQAAFFSGDYASAEAMFTKELADHPSAKLYYDRGAVRAAQGHAALAKADFAAALKLDPKNAFAEFALGRYALKDGDLTEADRRFADAEKDSGESAQMAGRIADALEGSKRFAAATPYLDRALAEETDNARKASFLNGRCWSRATAGQDLKEALDLCNAALAATAGQPDYLDSRALVELRLGAPEKAIDDYTAALAKRPGLWISLYGRGLAEQKLGRAKAAQTDIEAALAANPGAKAEFIRWGVAQ